MPKLTEMSVDDVMKNYRPEADLEWTWNDEYAYCWLESGPITNDIIARVQEQGLYFDPDHPIRLSNNGYVLDGRRRVLIAKYLKIDRIMVEMPHEFYSRHEVLEQERERSRQRLLYRDGWYATVDDIIWEHIYFKNAIPFNGDLRPIKEKNA